jgi:hypothetical protein
MMVYVIHGVLYPQVHTNRSKKKKFLLCTARGRMGVLSGSTAHSGGLLVILALPLVSGF